MVLLLNNILIHAEGLNSIWSGLKANWFGPAFFIVLAVFSFVFFKDRAWMKLITFVAFAAIIGVLVFASDTLFGEKGVFTGFTRDKSKEIVTGNGTIVVSPLAKVDTILQK